MADRRRKKPEELDETRGVFMISVAAELAGMHPQTLRVYEARGLISPRRSAKQTRLYSQRDVERLRRIQEMTSEGLNLAGVEMVLELEARMDAMRRRLLSELQEARRSLGGEIVPYGAYDSELSPPEEKPVKIPVEKKRKGKRNAGG